MSFDDRIVQVDIEVDGAIKSYRDLAITAVGNKFACSILSEATIKIYNMNKTDRDYLLTETSPFNLNRTPKVVTLHVGRKSYGTFKIFTGNVIAGEPTQPPDIGITLKSLSAAFLLGSVVTLSGGETASLKSLCETVAKNLSVNLDFQATEKDVDNYTFTGTATGQLESLEELSDIDVYIDNEKLVVKDSLTSLNGLSVVINKNTGMVGVPNITERGLSVKTLLNPAIRLGGSVTIESEINPAANGEFTVFKLGFDIANRDNSFYYNVECSKFII